MKTSQRKCTLTLEKENALICKAAAGDRTAMTQIFQQYLPLILRAAHQPHLATVREDAESEAMMSLAEAVHSYDPARGIPFAAYAKRKVFGDIRTFFRRERAKWQAEFVPAEGTEGESLWDTLPDSGQDMELLELQDALDRALAELPEKERHVLECIISGRMTQTELARHCGVAFQTITKWKQKAAARLPHLRRLLKGEES